MGLLFENYEQMRLQLKENEEEKEQNEKKSKELVSNISHDLKTPIQGQAQPLQRSQKNNQKYLKYESDMEFYWGDRHSDIG